MTWTLICMVLGAAFGVWSHWTSGSGGWSDFFVRRDRDNEP